MSHVRIAAAVCVAVALAGSILLAQGRIPNPKPPKLPVTIEVVAAKALSENDLLARAIEKAKLSYV